MEVADKQANNFRNPPEETGVNYVKQPHVQKAAKQRKLCFRCGGDHIPKNVDSNMKIVGTATRKGTSPKFAKRKHPLHVRSRIGGNSQFVLGT